MGCETSRERLREGMTKARISGFLLPSAILATMYRNPVTRVVYSSLVARRLGVVMGKLIGYARVSTRRQDADRQVEDLLAVGGRDVVDAGGGA